MSAKTNDDWWPILGPVSGDGIARTRAAGYIKESPKACIWGWALRE